MSHDGTYDVRQIVDVLRRWIWLIAGCVLVTAATAYYAQVRQPPIYEATATIIVELAYDSLSSQYNALAAGERLALTYSEMVRGTNILESAIAHSGVAITAAELHKLLIVSPVTDTQLIRLTVRHASPTTATLLANSVAQQFIAHVSEIQGARFDTYMADLRLETRALAANRRDIQSRLEAASADSVRTQTELASMQSLLTQLVQFGTTEGDAMERLVIANRLVKQLAPGASSQPTGLPGVESAPAENQIATIPVLIEQVQMQIDELASKASSANSDVVELELQLAESTEELRTRQRELEQIQLLSANGTDTIALSDPAVEPQRPIRHKSVFVILAAITGALVASSVALLHEYWTDTLKTSREADAALGIDVLGAVGHVTHAARNLAATDTSRPEFDEAYSILGARIRSACATNSTKTLLVTSAQEQAGKSLTAANLAVALARTGLDVIAVDADLRHSSLHLLFGLDRGKGLSDALRAGSDEAALQFTAFERVRVLTCGSRIVDPIQALSAPRMAEIFGSLEQKADIVVVDSPPLLQVADTTILASQVDGVLLVLRAGRTRRQSARTAVERLQQIGAVLIGLVMNDVTADVTGYYGYYDTASDGRKTVRAASPLAKVGHTIVRARSLVPR